MYERFTDRARHVMQLGRQAARSLGHEYFGTEHVLLALALEVEEEGGGGIAGNVLRNLGTEAATIRTGVISLISTGPEVNETCTFPQTLRNKKVIGFAMEESRKLNHNFIGTEHLLLGLLRETESVAVQILRNIGFDPEDIRKEVFNMLGHGLSEE